MFLRKEDLSKILKSVIGSNVKRPPTQLSKGDVLLYKNYLYEYLGENTKNISSETEILDSNLFKKLGLRYDSNEPYEEIIEDNIMNIYEWMYKNYISNINLARWSRNNIKKVVKRIVLNTSNLGLDYTKEFTGPDYYYENWEPENERYAFNISRNSFDNIMNNPSYTVSEKLKEYLNGNHNGTYNYLLGGIDNRSYSGYLRRNELVYRKISGVDSYNIIRDNNISPLITWNRPNDYNTELEKIKELVKNKDIKQEERFRYFNVEYNTFYDKEDIIYILNGRHIGIKKNNEKYKFGIYGRVNYSKNTSTINENTVPETMGSKVDFWMRRVKVEESNHYNDDDEITDTDYYYTYEPKLRFSFNNRDTFNKNIYSRDLDYSANSLIWKPFFTDDWGPNSRYFDRNVRVVNEDSNNNYGYYFQFKNDGEYELYFNVIFSTTELINNNKYNNSYAYIPNQSRISQDSKSEYVRWIDRKNGVNAIETWRCLITVKDGTIKNLKLQRPTNNSRTVGDVKTSKYYHNPNYTPVQKVYDNLGDNKWYYNRATSDFKGKGPEDLFMQYFNTSITGNNLLLKAFYCVYGGYEYYTRCSYAFAHIIPTFKLKYLGDV